MPSSFYKLPSACFAIVLALLPAHAAQAAPIAPASGTLERIDLHSAYVDDRPVDVWLPDGYAERARAGHRYQVLYMQDGQMLFDPATTWNRQAWRIDRALANLMREGAIADTIVVAVWNDGKYRASEYVPQKMLDRLPAAARTRLTQTLLENRPRSDAYLRYLVTELKPLIDRRYATRAEAAGTFIMGSSMGGLMAVYAFAEYPQVFGGAAGLSTHWVGGFEANAAFPLAAFGYLSGALPAPAGRRLYLDRGTATLDALYGPAQTFVDQIVRDRGYTDAGYMSRVFDGADHSENAWSERVELPLRFLLAPRAPQAE